MTKLTFYYKKLSLIQRLSIPLLIASLFGFLLTIVMVKQVHLIQNNTSFLKDELIPTFEKSTNNMTLLKNISDKLTFAALTAEEDMVLEISEHEIIEENLNKMLENESLNLKGIQSNLNTFQNYFEVATSYALNIIKNSALNDEHGVSADLLFKKHNEVKENFMKIKVDIEHKIAFRTNLIKEMSGEVVYYTVIYLLVFSIVLFFTSYINYKEFNDYEIIESQKRELAKVNKNLQSSIEYASLIQEAILPSNDILNGYTHDNFVFWKQKDTVGGDIYFVAELESKNEILVMVIDGVGHGVSGAFLTILTKALEVQIIEHINQGTLEASPSAILTYFNSSIKTILKQEKSSKSNVGFDGGVLYYNRVTNSCRYAGAKTALYVINNNELEVIKSDRQSVGFIRTKIDQTYTEYDIEVKKGTKLYISTDGITDQECLSGSRYGKKRFEKFLIDNHPQPFNQQLDLLKNNFMEVKGNLEQSDDITVIGLEFQ